MPDPLPHPGPLSGVRVIEFGIIYSAPYGGMHLADFGADVIKVETPEGEMMRGNAAIVPGQSKGFQWLNRGKRSLALNIASPEGKEVIDRLIPETDVVLINFRPGVAERLGIDYESLKRINPRIIYAEIIGFGSEGPMGGAAATDIVAQGYGGAIALDAKLDDDGAPVWVNIPLADLPGGMSAMSGILAALYHRERTGEGQKVTVSLLRVVMSLLGVSIMREPISDAHSRDLVVERINQVKAAGGSYDAIIKERGGSLTSVTHQLYFTGYRAKDGGIVIGALTKANREAVRKVVGIVGDPTEDPGFDPGDPGNPELARRLKAQVREKMLKKTVAEWMELFQAAGAPAGQVNIPEDLSDDPQGTTHMQEIINEVTGPQRQVRPLFDMSATPTIIPGGAPPLGRDNDTILRSIGYGDADLRRLREKHVIPAD